ncbi:uncharacterized protein LOC110655027 isoform X2 [Hevea brasiliensis]|uniref:uncharacterized protein LOC110655027 isoform X2 n=1 Tax=Hevea brasiliensis TaxID=3981 RepID=UPI0025DE286A|nr:uncharacterized protein LOC110655027 isoform X2 [Hevea brasiliensis]
MSESQENFALQDKTLSLIDVSFEDDCLYNSPSRDPQLPHFSENQTEHITVHLVGVRAPEDSNEGDEQVIQPLESAEQEKTRKNEKYNLRKSLAWDSAFFTSAGVLEPEELSTMIGGTEKGGKNHILPGIEEDIHRSTDSMSSFATDNSTLGTLEDDLFGDIRASIQKSSKASKAAISHASAKVDIVPQNKLKTKAPPNKPNVVSKGSRKLANQSGSTNGQSTSSFCKPPKTIGRVSPILISAAKRASLGANRVKMEKDSAEHSTGHSDNPKKLTGRGAKLPTMGGSRNTVPNPTLPFKSSLRSSVASKTELTTSASSVESLGSLSSDSSGKHSLNSVKRKTDSKTGNHSSTVSTVKSTLRTASRSKNQSTSSSFSPHLKSATKLSSRISPASSISERSLESVSPTSTLNKRTNSSRPSLDTTSCKDALDNGDALQVLDSQNHSSDKCSVGHDTRVIGLPSESGNIASTGSVAPVHPDSIKPSGLRMPSPKIGFFDGVRSTVRTPRGSVQSHPAVNSGLPRYRARNVSLSGGSNEAKLGKLQPARTALAVRGTKTGAQQPASEIKHKSPLPLQETSNTTPKVCSASSNGKYGPGMPLKVQNRMSPGNSGQSNLKAEKIAPKDCDTAINNPDVSYADGNDSLHKNKKSPLSESNSLEKHAESTAIHGGLGVTCNSSSVPEAKNIILSQKLGEDATCGQKKILGSLSNTNEKGKTCFEDEVDDLAQQVGATECCSLLQVSESGKVNASVIEEHVTLMPPSTLTATKGVKVEIDES